MKTIVPGRVYKGIEIANDWDILEVENVYVYINDCGVKRIKNFSVDEEKGRISFSFIDDQDKMNGMFFLFENTLRVLTEGEVVLEKLRGNG